MPPACTVNLGSGSGALTIDATSAHSGDVVCVMSGTYSGGNFSDLDHVTILPAGPITFTGSIGIHNTKGLTIDGTFLPGETYGFTFNGGGHAFDPGTGAEAHNEDVTFRGGSFDHTDIFVGDGNRITYDGSPATTLFTNLKIDTVKLTGNALAYNGTWEAVTTYHNVVMGLTISNVVALNEADQSSMRVFGNSLYHVLADHWTISGESLSANEGDYGIFEIVGGNATLRNIYRNGGYGYITRLWNVSIGGESDSYLYNIIDVNSSEYGTADVRIDPAQMAGSGNLKLTGNNIHLFNITSGNKKTRRVGSDGHMYYRTPLAIIGAFNDGTKTYDVELRNCFAFNNEQDDGGDVLARVYAPNDTHYIESNNVAVQGSLPDGYLVDLQSYTPTASGPLANAGLSIPETANDINGKPRGAKYDIGAVEH